MLNNIKTKKQKSFYKQWWFLLLVFVAVVSIGMLMDDGEEFEESKKVETTAPAKKVVEDTKEENPIEESVIEKTSVEEPSIDTSLFEYATVEVTDAIDINQHVTLKMIINDDSNPGAQVQNIITQTFDFLMQDDIKEAKTITIFVIQNDIKIVQYTVQKDKFIPNENESMVHLVLQASEIERMSEEVKKYGESLELW